METCSFPPPISKREESKDPESRGFKPNPSWGTHRSVTLISSARTRCFEWLWTQGCSTTRYLLDASGAWGKSGLNQQTAAAFFPHFLFCDTGSHYIAQTSLKFNNLLPQPLACGFVLGLQATGLRIGFLLG